MNFKLTEEQQMIAETALKIGQDYGLQYWRELDAKQEFPQEMWKAVCEAGFCGVALPESAGGVGLGVLEMALIVENLAKGGGGSTVGQLFMINPIFGGVAINRFGSDEMRNELLPGLISGDLNFCMALTEAQVGTNSLQIKTFAAEDTGGWRLNGEKIWITAVDVADKMLVICRTKKLEDADSKVDGMSMFMIDVDRKGITYGKIDKVGTNTLSSCSVFFDDVRVEPHELIGTLHGGWVELLEILNIERIATTAGLVGAADLAIELAVDYGNQRKVFNDTPVTAYQGIQFPLAQSKAEIECARLMNYKAASLCDDGLPFGAESNIAKLIAAQTTAVATERSMQTMGGMGYAKESSVERLWRDARLFRFAPVSEEMILNFIGVHELGMPRSY